MALEWHSSNGTPKTVLSETFRRLQIFGVKYVPTVSVTGALGNSRLLIGARVARSSFAADPLRTVV